MKPKTSTLEKKIADWDTYNFQCSLWKCPPIIIMCFFNIHFFSPLVEVFTTELTQRIKCFICKKEKKKFTYLPDASDKRDT